jgi:hypothetical protein
MEQFKAEEEDWQRVEAEAITHPIPSTICELRDRVAALEAKQAPGESPATAPAAPVVAVPSDQELWEVQLKVKSQSRPHIGWQVWSPESEPLIAAHRALYDHGYDHGYQQGLAAGRAEQQAAAEATPEPEPSPSPAAAGGLEDVIAGIIGNEPIIGRPCPAAGAVILAVAKWLRSMGNFSAATNLEREANR